MSILRAVVNGKGLQASAVTSGGHPRDPALASLFPVSNTTSGQVVNATTAMRSSAVHGCVRILAETLASLPLALYKETDEGKEKAKGNNLYYLLHDQPNPWQTSYEFREMMMGHVLLTGAAYAEVVRDNSGRIAYLMPLHPRRVMPFRYKESMAYQYTETDGTQRVLFTGEVLVIRNMMSDDGITPLSPIGVAREAIGLSLAAEDHGSRLFSNDATPAGVLEHPGTLDAAAVKRLRESWENTHQGSSNAHKTAILEGGLKYNAISISPKDSQFIEARKYQIEDIARVYRVPPHMLADLSKATFSNIEQQSLDFIAYSMLPWFTRWEQAIKRDLFLPRDRRAMFVEFIVAGILRGDVKTRYEAYSKGIVDGWLNRNEVRAMEGLNRVEGLDEYLVPLNMGEAEDDDEEPEEEQPEPEETTDPEEPVEPEEDEAEARMARVLKAAEGRVDRKEVALLEKHGPDALRDERHIKFIMEVLAVDRAAAEARVELRTGAYNEEATN